jgi:molybdopterin converting factor small subunit
LRVLLYGQLADTFGREIEVESATVRSVGELRHELRTRHPEAAEALSHARACGCKVMVSDDQLLLSDHDLEFLPPVSGG